MSDWTADDARAALERVTRLVQGLPEAQVQPTSEYGHTGFALGGTRFAWLTVDHHEDGRLALWVRSTLEEQRALVEGDPGRFFVPPYSGPQGWVGAVLDPAADPDWDEVAELLEAGWRAHAPKRAQRILDRQRVLDQQQDRTSGPPP